MASAPADAAEPGSVAEMQFVHEWMPQRVVFATGRARSALSAEVERLGARRLMVIAAGAGRPIAAAVTAGLPVAVEHDEVVMHVPAAVARRAREVAAGHDVDALVSIGGGSTTGLAKAVALSSGLPIIAVPTTYAGSEATSVWGLTEDSRKATGIDARVLPRSIVYDATLTTSLPVPLSVASGLNALAHCVDAMWGPRVDPIDRAVAGEGIRALAAGLPAVVDGPAAAAGREQTLYGAYLAGVAFSSAGSGLHHKICHVLGGMFNLPHAQTHAVLLPHVLAFNASHAPDAAARIAAALGSADPTAGLAELYRRLDAPHALRDYGLAEADIPAAVEPILAAAPADNPTPVTADAITRLLRAAWGGAQPT